jgi:hypothetical protein
MRKVINRKRLHTWEAMTGVSCFLAGLLAPLLGILFSVIEWIVGAAVHPWIHVAGTALFIVAIPLILFAGFCLDWAAQGQKRRDSDEARGGAAALGQVTIVATILGMVMPASCPLPSQLKTFDVPGNGLLDRGKVHTELDSNFTP